MHAAHRGAHDEAQMVHMQALCHQQVLRQHHVVIVVMREFRVQPVARLGGFAVADAVGQDDVVLADVEKATRHEQHAGELWPDELMPVAAGAVHHDHRIGDAAVAILAMRRAQGRVVQPQVGQRLARTEFEIMDDIIAFHRAPADLRPGPAPRHRRKARRSRQDVLKNPIICETAPRDCPAACRLLDDNPRGGRCSLSTGWRDTVNWNWHAHRPVYAVPLRERIGYYRGAAGCASRCDAGGVTMQGWHDFYEMIGGAAATLLGLLFVSVSLNAEIILGPAHRHSKRLAEQAFQNYLCVLLVSLLVAFPGISMLSLGNAMFWATVVWSGRRGALAHLPGVVGDYDHRFAPPRPAPLSPDRAGVRRPGLCRRPHQPEAGRFHGLHRRVIGVDPAADCSHDRILGIADPGRRRKIRRAQGLKT